MVESVNDMWRLMLAFFEEKGLVRQHLDSYNTFIDKDLQAIIDEQGVIETDIENFYVKLGRIEVGEPSITEADGSTKIVDPTEARLRNLTYAAPMFMELTPVWKVPGTDIETPGETVKVYIGKMPIMLKSNRCVLSKIKDEQLLDINEDPKDPGGYFIINGSERVIVTQEDLAPNRILIEKTSSTSTSTHVAKVFSTARGFRAPVMLERSRDGSFKLSFPSVPGKIPLAIMLRALGLITDKQIMDAISDDPEVRRELIPTLEEAAPIYSPKDPKQTVNNVLDYIGKRVAIGQTLDYRLKKAEQVIDKYLLPHIGVTSADRLNKAYYLCQMALRIIELVLGRRPEDDKDHYSNKRLKLAGELLASLFRNSFLNLTRDIKYQLERTAV
ncbi:MAG: DNA-directed RNA polymerase subunit B'', partial [Candidatus Odinarchaeota archaeon]